LATFAGDKAHRDAALFLSDRADDHYGLWARYTNDGENDLNAVINNFLGDTDMVDSLSAFRVIDTLWDRDHVRTDHIIENTKLAFRHYRENPLKMEVPDSIFYEYILPYRVGHEKITGNWRVHFNRLYGNYLKSFDEEKDEAFINRMVGEIQRLSFHPHDHSGLARYYRISPEPSFAEIREVAHPYSCEDYAMFKLYSYRSLGLAAAYEVVPLYGKFNHGHGETALFHRDGKFHCTEGKTEMPYKYQIAKMYRRRFSKRESPYQKILSLGEREENIPGYFDMPYYEDITKERTIVSDITVSDGQIGGETVAGVLYICVYNDGEWKPVEWASRHADKWRFRNMGRKILYHLCAYEHGYQKLLGSPMVLDTLGNVGCLAPPQDEVPRKLTVKKHDRSKNISEGKFKLYRWEDKRWHQMGIFPAEGNGLSLPLSENALYKLEKNETNTRPFSMENGEQIWW